MWTITTSGFTSVVEYNPPRTHYDPKLKKDVPYDPPFDPAEALLPEDYKPATTKYLSSHLLVRARIKADLDKLMEYDPDCVYVEDKSADYRHRLIVRRTAYAQFVHDSAMAIDYSSHVKETIDKRAPKIPGGRYSALSKVWSAFGGWQENGPYGRKNNDYTGGSYNNWYDKDWKSKSNDGWIAGHYDSLTNKWVKGHHVDDEEKSYDLGNTKDFDDILDSLETEQAVEYDADSQEIYYLDSTGDYSSLEPTMKSMEVQVREFLDNVGEDTDISQMLEKLQDSYGTVDLDELTTGELMAIVDACERELSEATGKVS